MVQLVSETCPPCSGSGNIEELCGYYQVAFWGTTFHLILARPVEG